MINFLLCTCIKPLTKFFHCFPLRCGIFLFILIHTGILLYDLFEHQYAFGDKDLWIYEKWITMGVQISVSFFLLINVIVKVKVIRIIFYVYLIIITILITFQKALKVYDVQNVVSEVEGVELYFYMGIYGVRCLVEIMIYLFITYLCYSYACLPIESESLDEDAENAESFVEEEK